MILKHLGKIFLFFLLTSSVYGAIEFKQEVSKTRVHLNETIKITLILTFDNSENIDQVYFEEYDTYQFWLEQLGDEVIIRGKDTTTYTYQFLLDPKKVGEFILDEQIIKISSDEIRRFKRWKKIASNENTIKVLPLYNDLQIQGDYTIDLQVAKEKLKENEGLSVTLVLKGEGNLKDIQKFTLPLENQIVYSETPLIKKEFIDNNYKGSVEQKFFIIAGESFTIPSIEFEFYNPKLKKVKKIGTKPFFIEVEKEIIEQGDHYLLKYIFAFLGLIIGIFLYQLIKWIKKIKRQQKLPIIQEIKKCKTEKELYSVLITNYSKRKEFEVVIKLLEENIYNKFKNKIEKRKIIKIIYAIELS